VIVRHAKSLLKQFASPVLDGLGLYDRQLCKMPANRWTIVMYHRVIEDPSMDPFSLGMCVTRHHFEEQLDYLKRHFSPIGMREAVARIERGEPLPERALSITFDDGYLDNHTVALPALQARGMPATLFVPTGGLDDDQPLWWDRVIHALDATGRPDLVPAELGVPLPGERLSLGSWNRNETTMRILDSLWTLPIERLLDVVSRIEKGLPPVRAVAPVARRMNSRQLLEMHRAGVELGAHSVRHPNLILETADVVREEMRTSRDYLEALCDTPVAGFAYPAGWKSDDAVAAARETGFRYAVATVSGINTERNDLFSLSRVGMPDTRVSDFKRALAAIVQRVAER
jgi:peptidoglycan/xylan/chitin deacetylase (PgdA/CDA1 family)